MKMPSSIADLTMADAIEIFSICNQAGIHHREALARLLMRLNRKTAGELFECLKPLDDGTSAEDVIESMTKSSNARIREFALAVSLSARLGTSLTAQLHNLVQQIRHQWLLDFRLKATQVETQMIIPQVAISLPLTILFALYPSLQMLSGSI